MHVAGTLGRQVTDKQTSSEEVRRGNTELKSFILMPSDGKILSKVSTAQCTIRYDRKSGQREHSSQPTSSDVEDTMLTDIELMSWNPGH